MRNLVFSLGIVLLLASSAGAQSSTAISPSPYMSPTRPTLSPLSEFALNAPAAAAAPIAPTLGESLPAAPSANGPQRRGVYSVYQNYSFQLYGGYTFMRFYEVPGVTQTQNGFNIGGVYYYHQGVVGADGELVAMFGSALGYHSRLAFVGGGPRFRWSGPRGLELWGHALVGGAHLTPRTAYGSQGAFGYEVGGGVDIAAGHHKIAYRAEADLLGTRFFSTYQYSPKVSVGIVFKF